MASRLTSEREIAALAKITGTGDADEVIVTQPHHVRAHIFAGRSQSELDGNLCKLFRFVVVAELDGEAGQSWFEHDLEGAAGRRDDVGPGGQAGRPNVDLAPAGPAGIDDDVERDVGVGTEVDEDGILRVVTGITFEDRRTAAQS